MITPNGYNPVLVKFDADIGKQVMPMFGSSKISTFPADIRTTIEITTDRQMVVDKKYPNIAFDWNGTKVLFYGLMAKESRMATQSIDGLARWKNLCVCDGYDILPVVNVP